MGRLHAQCGGIAVAQVALEVAADVVPRPVGRKREPGRIGHLGDLVHQKAVFGQLLANHFEHGKLRRIVAGEFLPESSLQAQELLLARLPLAVDALKRIRQVRQPGAGVGAERYGRRAPATESAVVRLQPHHRQAVVQTPFQFGFREPRADRQHRVRIGPQRVGCRKVDPQIVALVDDALGIEVGGRRRLQYFRHALEFRSGIQRARSGDDDRISRGTQNSGRLLHRVRVRRARFVRGGRFEQRGFAATLHHVRSHFQRHRKRPSRMQLPKRLGHHFRRSRAARNTLGPLRQPLQDPELIVDLVQHAPAPVDVLRRDLARQTQHAGVGGIGRDQSGSRVEDAGSGHHAEHPGAPGGGGIAQRHIGRALFVAGVDDLGGTLVLRQRVEQSVGLTAREPEDGIDAVRQHRAHQRFASRHFSLHGR